MMTATLYWNHVTLDIRVGVMLAVVALYTVLVILAFRDQKKTTERISTRYEWMQSQFAPWLECLILGSLLTTLWNVTLVLKVERPSPSAQLIGTLAALLLLARGVLALIMRRRSSSQVWKTGKFLRDHPLTEK